MIYIYIHTDIHVYMIYATLLHTSRIFHTCKAPPLVAASPKALVLFFDTLPRSAHALACWEYGARILGEKPGRLEDFGGCLDISWHFYVYIYILYAYADISICNNCMILCICDSCFYYYICIHCMLIIRYPSLFESTPSIARNLGLFLHNSVLLCPPTLSN